MAKTAQAVSPFTWANALRHLSAVGDLRTLEH